MAGKGNGHRAKLRTNVNVAVAVTLVYGLDRIRAVRLTAHICTIDLPRVDFE